MTGMISFAFALLAGVLLGSMFFAGLWWTVQKAVSSKQPGILFAGSFMGRTILALGGFYFVGGGNWSRLVACLVGFVLGRMLVKRLFDRKQLTLEAQPLNGRA